MLDIKQIRQQPDWFKEKLATRAFNQKKSTLCWNWTPSGANSCNKPKP